MKFEKKLTPQEKEALIARGKMIILNALTGDEESLLRVEDGMNMIVAKRHESEENQLAFEKYVQSGAILAEVDSQGNTIYTAAHGDSLFGFLWAEARASVGLDRDDTDGTYTVD